MRVRTITPLHLTEEEIARRQVRYNQLAPAGVEMVMANLPADADVPRSLGTEAECRASDHVVYQVAMQTDPAEFDAIFLDCVLDPSLAELERDAPIPVYGITKLAGMHLANADHRFAAVTRNQIIGDELAACIERHGFADHFAGVKVLHLSFDDIADDTKWNAALGRVLNELSESNVSALFNGCSAVNVEETGHNIAVIDPTALALQQLSHETIRL